MTYHNRAGFALVIAISLVAFLFLLVIGFSSLLMIESRSAEAGVQQQQARQNAIFGLSVALGELQRVAGPDQRVTARADITESYAAATAGTGGGSSSLANPGYTAVWNVEPMPAGEGELSSWPGVPGQSPGADKRLAPIYLVSGNEGQRWGLSPQQAAEQYLTGDSVNFVNEIEFTEAGVVVEGVEIPHANDFAGGRYGWWIGDEGVKARLNRSKPISSAAATSDAGWTRSAGASPQLVSSDLRGLDWSGLATTASTAFTVPDLAMLGSQFSSFASNGPETPAPYFDDFTLQSQGLLVDVRNGGLKKDLSYILRTDGAGPAELAANQRLFPMLPGEMAAPATRRIYEPTWGFIRDYVKGIPRVSAGSAIVLEDEAWANSTVVDMRVSDGERPGITPVITNTKLQITPFLIAAPSGSGGEPRWQLFYRANAAIVLWNPYDVAMKLPELKAFARSYTGSNSIFLGRDAQAIKIEVRNQNTFEGGAGLITRNYTDDPAGLPSPAMESLVFTIPATVIPAGRAVVFSPRVVNEILNSSSVGNRLEPGWRPDGSFAFSTGIEFDWDPTSSEVSSQNMRIWFSAGAGANASLRYGPFRATGGAWDLLKTNVTQGYITDRSEIITQLINAYFYQSGNLINAFARDLLRYENLDAEIIGSPGVYPPIGYTQMASLKFGTQSGQDLTTSLSVGLGKAQWASHFNPRAEFASASFGTNANAVMPTMYSTGLYLNADATSIYDNLSLAADDGNAEPSFVVVGNSWSDFNSGRAVLYSLPDDEVSYLNIGALQHVNLASSTVRPLGGENPRGGPQYAPAYTIGNSIASPLIAPEELGVYSETAYGGNTRFYLPDLVYLANEALYDRFFLSEVGGSSGESLNPLYFQHGDDSPTTGATGYDQNAAALMVDGAFNVNSTSVEAWAAFLAGVIDQQVRLQNGSVDSQSGLPQSRLRNPVSTTIPESDLVFGNAALVNGFRRLSDAEIRALAEQIVEEVKIRGPFSSMSAFVNRAKGDPDSDWTLDSPIYRDDVPTLERKRQIVSKGALQAALDTPGSDMPNNRLLSDSGAATNLSTTFTNALNPGALEGVVTQGTPGYVMQSDLLSVFDSVMTTRSDTFRILAYGESRNPLTGDVESIARCEAVVQRLPEYVDADADEAWSDPYLADGSSALSSEINQLFGRQYRIVSFRWLN